MESASGISDRFLEQALEELEVLRAENEVLKQKLSKAILIFKKIKKLLEKRNEKRRIFEIPRPERVCETLR